MPVPGGVIEWDGEVFRGVTHEFPFAVATPEGPRAFKAVTYLGGDDVRAIAVLDLDQQRVLLTRHGAERKGADTDLAAEISRLAALPWDEFRAFIAGHEFRRYVL